MKYRQAIKLARQEGNLSYWGLWQNYDLDINKYKTRTALKIIEEHSRSKPVKKEIGDCAYWYSWA